MIVRHNMAWICPGSKSIHSCVDTMLSIVYKLTFMRETDRQTDRRTDGRKDGRTDGRTHRGDRFREIFKLILQETDRLIQNFTTQRRQRQREEGEFVPLQIIC